MNGFKPPVTPARIVNDNWLFSIPIYQRLFVWESEQIDRLLDDLWMASQTKDDQPQPYYIGVITTVKQSGREDGQVFSVVDGQQRLTFLLLFFCDCLARGEITDNAERFVFANQCHEQCMLRISFLGRDEDEKDIQFYATKDTAKIKNMNFRQFHARMEIFVKKHNDWESKKGQFINYVFTNTSFLVNELVGYSNADLNLYFEKMNSMGRQLSPLEQLKGSFAEYALDWNDCFNFEMTRDQAKAERTAASTQVGNDIIVAKRQQNFMDETCSLDNIITWEKSVAKEPPQNQEHSAYSRLPMRPEVMALHVLQLTLNMPEIKALPTVQMILKEMKIADNEPTIDFSPRYLLDKFKPIISPDISTDNRYRIVESFINELKSYRDWIDGNIIYLRGEADGNDAGDSDTSGLRFAFRDTQESTQNKKMLQLQSMLYVSSGEKQEWILQAYESCKAENGERTPLSFEALRNMAWEYYWAPVRKNIDTLSYSPGMNRLAFWILDYLLWEKVFETDSHQEHVRISFCDGVVQELSRGQIAAIKGYRFTQNRSVEHLHPQNPPSESESADWKIDRENGDKVRNGFGNLCMISQSTNSSLSYEPVDVKFAKIQYALQGHPLQSIKLLFMFACCGGKHEQWTPEQATKHGCNMLKILGFDNGSIAKWKENLDTNIVKTDK